MLVDCVFLHLFQWYIYTNIIIIYAFIPNSLLFVCFILVCSHMSVSLFVLKIVVVDNVLILAYFINVTVPAAAAAAVAVVVLCILYFTHDGIKPLKPRVNFTHSLEVKLLFVSTHTHMDFNTFL